MNLFAAQPRAARAPRANSGSPRRSARRVVLAILSCLLVLGSLAIAPGAARADTITGGPDITSSSDAVPGVMPNPSDASGGTFTDTGVAAFPDAVPAADLGTQAASSAADGFMLADAGIDLGQVDLSTGAVVGDTLDETMNDTADTTLGLAAIGGALAFDPSVLDTQAQAQQAQQQASAEQQQANANAAPQSQQTVGPDGCPTSAPPNTMRGGAPPIAQLCADSVAQARSPQAALAIKAALNHLGIPYSEPQRNSPGYYDCSSFVTRMYDIAGVNLAPPGQNAPTTFTIASAPWAVSIPYSQGKPGDIVEPFPTHATMLLADGMLVETSSTGDVSHVTARYYTAPYLTVWIDPSKV